MSNLLKDASILLTPTGYDNGRMNAIKPYKDLYGSEQGDDSVISNSGDAVMTKTSSLNYNATSGGAQVSSVRPRLLFNNVTVGKKYRITIKATNRSGTILFKLFDGSSYVIDNNNLSSDINFTFTAQSSTSVNFNFDGREVFNVDLEISLKEDLSGDFNFERNSAATRVNAQGLVENVQIISSELVSNGNFSQIGTEEVLNGNFSQEGSELVTNGDFSQGSQDWSLIGTATITENQANIVTTSAVTGISQSNILTVGKNYKLSYNIVSNNNGGLKISGNEIPSVVGNNTYYFTASVAALEILRNSGATDISITNISVKEVGQNWSLGLQIGVLEKIKQFVLGQVQQYW